MVSDQGARAKRWASFGPAHAALACTERKLQLIARCLHRWGAANQVQPTLVRFEWNDSVAHTDCWVEHLVEQIHNPQSAVHALFSKICFGHAKATVIPNGFSFGEFFSGTE